MIGAVILAAGESRRMGSPKLLLPYRGSTMIESVLEAVTASDVESTVVVLGAGRGPLRKKIRRFPVSEIVNLRYRRGMLSSIQCGVAALPGGCRAALVVLGDQPGISAAVIDALIAAYQKGRECIVVPVFRGRRGHPLLVDLKYRDEIAALSPETGLRALFAAHPDDILEVVLTEASILEDIDTPEEYQKALGQAK